MIPSRVSTYLDQHGVQYDVCSHEHSRSSAETARTAHVPPAQLAKAVLLEDDDGCVMAVIPADKNVMLHEVARMLGRKELHLADENRIASLFEDCERGALPPLGMAWGIETVVDNELEACNEVYLEGGDHEQLLRLSRDQFQALMSDALHGRIAKQTLH